MLKMNRFILLFSFLLGLSLGAWGIAQEESNSNKAARINLVQFFRLAEISGQKAPQGKIYVLLETEWENIHPKQKVKKSDLERKPDRTMGVGKLREGKREEKEDEYVDRDVPYVIPNFFDHAYLLADGQTYSLDKLSEVIPDGYVLNRDFTIAKYGERKKVGFVYLVPEVAKNISFRLFDYSNGHILVPVQGDPKLAAGTGTLPGRYLGQIKDNMVEIAAQAFRLQNQF